MEKRIGEQGTESEGDGVGSESEIIRSMMRNMWHEIDPCGICGKKVTVNSVLCTKCDQWIHERCSKLKKKSNSKCDKIFCL